MKNLFVALLLCIATFIQAQEVEKTKNKKDRKEARLEKKSNEGRLSKMVAELNLTETQQEKIKPILEEQTAKIEKMKAAFENKTKSNEGNSEKNKTKLKKKMMKIKDEYNEKYKSILTPEQYTKFEEIQNERTKKMKTGKKEETEN